MNKEKIRAIVVKVVLAFCAVFVVMTIIGLLVPVGNANPSSDNIEFSSDISLLNFDNSRSYEVYEMSEVDPSRAKKISSYDYNEKDARASGNFIAKGHEAIVHLFEK